MRSQPDQVAGDPRQFAHDDSKSLSPFGDIYIQQFFRCQTEGQVVARRIEIVQPVCHRDDMNIPFIFGIFFDAGVQIANFRFSGFHHLAIHLKNDPKNPVSARMLGPHIQGHGVFIAFQQSLFSYAHKSPYRVGGFDLTNSLLKSRLYEKVTASVVKG